MSDHTQVIMSKIPMCDFSDGNRAEYDAATKMGPWAYMCQEHFDQYGVGLGLGRGQRLIQREASNV